MLAPGGSRSAQRPAPERETLTPDERQMVLLEAHILRFSAVFESSRVECGSQSRGVGYSPQRVDAVAWLLLNDGCVLLEKCPRNAHWLGLGEWCVPGGKIEADETPEQALRREIAEALPTVKITELRPLPKVEGTSAPAGGPSISLICPFAITVATYAPAASAEGVPLRWIPVSEALASPVPQVRMIVAAAGEVEPGHARPYGGDPPSR